MKPNDIPDILERIAAKNVAKLSDEDQRALLVAAFIVRRRMVRPWDEDVRDFQMKFRHYTASQPTLPDRGVMELRQRLIQEEFLELYEALETRDLPQIAHESVDLVYVVLGTMASCGLSFEPFWRLIHNANMLKEPNPEPNGKTLKPPGWVKPDCATLIQGEVIDLDPIETLRRKP